MKLNFFVQWLPPTLRVLTKMHVPLGAASSIFLTYRRRQMERIMDKKHEIPEGIVNHWIKSSLKPIYLQSFLSEAKRLPYCFNWSGLSFCYLHHNSFLLLPNHVTIKFWLSKIFIIQVTTWPKANMAALRDWGPSS